MHNRLIFLTLLLASACADKAEDGAETGIIDPGDDTGEIVDNDGDGVPASEDCDDDDATVSPNAAEVCDGRDNNCDGATDEGTLSTFYADGDDDGFGEDALPIEACEAPEGYAAQGGDCDDGDAAFYPGAAETDCGDPNDYNCDGSTGYADADGDGFPACEDCDDGAAEANPGGVEVCDGLDNDCDEVTDEEDAIDAPSWYADTDGDGHGDADFPVTACAEPEGYASASDDCDDGDADVNPDAQEVCDALDNDCDGAIDDADDSVDLSGGATTYADQDGDGYGDSAAATLACAAPAGDVANNTDCDDDDGAVNPGASEVCDERDNDCDGAIDDDDASLDLSTAETFYIDGDLDGYGGAAGAVLACEQPSGAVTTSTDCDDSDASVSPAATETCDGEDDDCDGVADEDAAVLGDDAACAASSCAEILAARPSAPDGVYSVTVSGVTRDMVCDMTDDGGGWTLVANFVWPGSTAGVAGWTSGSAVGSTTSDLSQTFKLSDADINTLSTSHYRAWGTATMCTTGACTVDITLYWSAACTYNSGAHSSGACATAYRDAALSDATGWTDPCSWHYGLTSASCTRGVPEMGTSHIGEHVFAGVEDSGSHAYDGRAGEDPSVEVWAR
jgi:hypothetical protein